MRADEFNLSWPVCDWRTDGLLVFGSFAVLAWLSLVVAAQPGTVAVIWLANGAASALIASAAPSRTGWLLGAMALGNLAANLTFGRSLLLSLAFLPANVMEVALAVMLLRRVPLVGHFASSVRGFARVMVAGALLPPLLGALVGATTLQALGFASFEHTWVAWYIGAAMGAVALLPLVLALRALPGAQGLHKLIRPGPGGGIALVLVVVAALAAMTTVHYPFIFIGVALLALALSQARFVTFTAAPLLVSATAVMLALQRFVPHDLDATVSHVEVYSAMLLTVLSAQVVAVLVARQRSLTDTLSALGSRSDEIVVLVDMEGRFRWVNRARQTYTGQADTQVLGLHWREVAAPLADLEVVARHVELARQGQTVQTRMDIDFPRRPGRQMDLLWQPALDEEGRQIGVLSIAIDVTERERANRRLQELSDQLLASNHSLEQFVRIASHDLREPMNTVLQFSDLLLHRPGLDSDAQTWLGLVQSGTARMKRMLDDILQYVRMDGASPTAHEPVPLDEVAAEVLADLQALLQRSGGQVTVLPLGLVQGHRPLLRVLLQNLLANALKFMPPDRAPQVTISATQGADGWCLAVQDNGIGIPAARLAEVGTPFRRLHSHRRFEGTGLGLAICKRVAEQHGGRLEISSVPDVGTRFALVVPAR